MGFSKSTKAIILVMKSSYFVFAFLVIISFSQVAMAQPGNPSTPTPFGFMEVLIGTALLYGGKQSLRRRK